jgi:hypothetical protein
MSKWTELVESYLSLVGRNPRSAHVASTVASDTALQRTLEQAAEMGQQNKVFARVAGTYEMPTVDRAAMAYGERGMPGRRSVEQVARDGVAEELGPFFREAPMEQVNDAQSLLGPTLGGEDLVARLEGMTPRPLYAMDLTGDTSPAFQLTDLTFGQRAAMNPPRAMDPDVMAGFRVNFERQGDELSSAMESLAGDISAGRQVAGAPGYEPDINMMGMDEGSVLGWPDNMPAARRPSDPAPTRTDAAVPAADDIEVPPRSPRGAPRSSPRISEGARQAAKAAAVGGLGAAAYYGMQGLGPAMPSAPAGSRSDAPAPPRLVPNITSKPRPYSTADLAAETSPPPSVMTEDPIMIDYSQMARDKIRQANEIQLREGRITPESAALGREADALYQRAAEERRKGNHPGIMPVEQQNEQTSAIRARQRRAG